MEHIELYIGAFIALAFIGWRYANDWPAVKGLKSESYITFTPQFRFHATTALGALALFVAFVPVLIAYGFYRLFKKITKKG